jgi:hypothetical protein
MQDKLNPQSSPSATVIRGGAAVETLHAAGRFDVVCHGPDGQEKWRDVIYNTVMTEGMNALLVGGFKASTFTQTGYVGIIESTGYSSYNAANTAANITAAGGGSPTNGWNEATSSMYAARNSITWGSASGGSLAFASASQFSITASATIKGAFVLIKDTGGTAPTSTVGNTNGALWSAGNFSGGDKTVGNGDTLSVSYTTTLS